MEQTQSFGPILILLVLIVSFLYMHFTNGSGLTRIYLAGAIVLAAILILLPSLNIVDLPDWFKAGFGATKIELGLDLQGGTHLLMAVKLDEAVKTQLRRRADDLKKALKDDKMDFQDISVDDSGNLIVKLKSSADRTPFLDLVQKSFPDLAASSNTDSSSPGPVYSLNFKPQELQTIKTNAMDQALETIRNRIDQLGVRETTVAKEGDNEILVQLPGIQDPERAKELIGKTAVLQFKLVDDTHSVEDAIKNGPPPGDEILYGTSERGTREPYLVESPVLMAGDVVTDARVRPGARLEGPYVAVELDNRGADIFDAMTAENVGRRLAIVLDNTVYSAPVIKERIPGGHVQITGRFSMEEAHDLRDRVALGRAAGAGRNRRGAHGRPVARPRFDSPGRDVIRDRRGRGPDFHGRVLQRRRPARGLWTVAEYPAAHLRDGSARRDAHLARHRRNRVDARHVGRRQRAGERAHARGVAQRQVAARGGEARLRTRVVGDSRLQYLDLRGGADPFPIWNRSGQRVCRHSMRRSADRPVFLYCGYQGVVRLQDPDAQVGHD